MAIIELKPCPFCGSTAHIDKQRRFPEDIDGLVFNYKVVCSICFAQTCEYHSDEKSAIKAWNRRADK